MSKPVKVVLNRKAVGQLLRHPNLKKDLVDRAKRIQTAAGGDKRGFKADSFEGYDRSRAQVVATTHTAKSDEAKHRALTKALNAGR
ncbi:hypothetical protein [Kocuria sp. TGY1127_2]|uniref:hypothetical protein n=1 Tax=Kocuria sp. TGY1127_2 TaxID=2711328 RepID=UPI0015BA9E20|nr:hypothetical protein [Kocuria sp. TGY1127_2]